jgi:hypothetical protein
MFKYKILIKLIVLNCVFVRCVYDDTVQMDVVVLCLLVWLHSLMRHRHMHTHARIHKVLILYGFKSIFEYILRVFRALHEIICLAVQASKRTIMIWHIDPKIYSYWNSLWKYEGKFRQCHLLSHSCASESVGALCHDFTEYACKLQNFWKNQLDKMRINEYTNTTSRLEVPVLAQ